MLVTVPIGSWIASFVFDVVSRLADDPEPFTTGALWLIGIGTLGAVAAAIFGFLDWLGIPAGTPAARTGTTHMILNLMTIGAFTASFFVRLSGRLDEPVPIGLIAVSVLALGALSISGWLGGKMAYRYGVRVADERVQREGFRAALRGE